MMKKIFFILILTVGTLYAKPCTTDIYFGNGVWNTRTQGEDGMWALRRFMQNGALSPLTIEDEKNKLYAFKHAYNPSHGTLLDLVETFWQLKESGQITEEGFHGYYAGLLSSRDGQHYHERLQEIIANYNADINMMYNQYKNSSFNQKHNILLVAHSQGNLFGNKIYTMLTDTQKKKFRMVSVATPANHVMKPDQTAPYVTARNDLVIGLIHDSLTGNVDGFGHGFIGTYLGSSFEARTQIALHVKSAYDDLMQTTTCTEYKFTVITMPTFGVLNVYGNIRYGQDELVGTVTLPKSAAVLNDDNKTYRCPSEDSFYWGGDSYCCYNWTTYKDDKNNNWLPGQYITNRSDLDHKLGTTDTVRKDRDCVQVSLIKDGDLYNIIYDMFPE